MGFLDYGAQASLENVQKPLPRDVRSDNQDFEKQVKLGKTVTEQYHGYRGNYSGSINFDIEDGSKQCIARGTIDPGYYIFSLNHLSI